MATAWDRVVAAAVSTTPQWDAPVGGASSLPQALGFALKRIVFGLIYTAGRNMEIARTAIGGTYQLPKSIAGCEFGVEPDPTGYLQGLILLGSLIVLPLIVLHVLLRQRSLLTRALVSWFWINGTTHLLLEQAYLQLALLGQYVAPWDLFVDVWKEYGRVDNRWACSLDAVPVSLEVLTVYGAGIACLFLIAGRVLRTRWFHFLQIMVATAELYGGFMTFAPEWFTGNQSLDTSDPRKFWTLLVGANLVWVVVPVLQLVHSYVVLTRGLATYPLDIEPVAIPFLSALLRGGDSASSKSRAPAVKAADKSAKKKN